MHGLAAINIEKSLAVLSRFHVDMMMLFGDDVVLVPNILSERCRMYRSSLLAMHQSMMALSLILPRNVALSAIGQIGESYRIRLVFPLCTNAEYCCLSTPCSTGTIF